MSNRLYVRVTLHGNDARRELMLDGRKVSDFDYQDAAALVRGLVEAFEINPKQPVPLIIDGQEIELSFVEAIETAMQVTSSLRW